MPGNLYVAATVALWNAWLLIPGGVAVGLLHIVLPLPSFSTAPARAA